MFNRMYDKLGKEIDVHEWGKLTRDLTYKIIKQEWFDNYLISTVWLGLGHQYGKGPPLIFETMVFPVDSWRDLDCVRASTETEALDNHASMVDKWIDDL